jgi:hypothetical protein
LEPFPETKIDFESDSESKLRVADEAQVAARTGETQPPAASDQRNLREVLNECHIGVSASKTIVPSISPLSVLLVSLATFGFLFPVTACILLRNSSFSSFPYCSYTLFLQPYLFRADSSSREES